MNKLRLMVSAVLVIVLLLTAAPVLAGTTSFPRLSHCQTVSSLKGLP